MSKPSRTPFSDQLRRLIDESDESRNAISKATGIDAATLARFMAKQGGLSIAGLDRLAKHLGWVVTSAKPLASETMKKSAATKEKRRK
jgi:hypothetical protein